VASAQKQTAVLTIVVQCRNHAGRRGQPGRYRWAWGLGRRQLSSLRWVRESYRRRFRIESSYRLLEAARGRTSSREEGWRLWYVVLAALLLNAWLYWRREVSRGGAAGEWRWWTRLLVALTVQLLEPFPADEQAAPTNPPPRE
jgi:putative transposase